MDVMVIEGSPRPRAESRSFAIAELAGRHARRRGHGVQVVRVVDLDPVSLVHQDLSESGLGACAADLLRSNALVVVTPIFQASFSGLLKVFLDLLPRTALEGKPTLPLATCGSATDGSVVTFTLPPVLTALGCHHVVPALCMPPARGKDRRIPDRPRRTIPSDHVLRLDDRMDLLLAAANVHAMDRPRPLTSSVPVALRVSGR